MSNKQNLKTLKDLQERMSRIEIGILTSTDEEAVERMEKEITRIQMNINSICQELDLQ